MTHDTSLSPLTATLGGPASPYTPPFSVQGSSVLSEDYFLTGSVIMNADDIVRPFVRADGSVEALLLAGGVVSHLSRSGTATSGWTCTPLPAPTEVPQAQPVDVVTATAADGTVWALMLRIFKGEQLELMIGSLLKLGSSGTWEWVEDSPLAHGGLGRLQSGFDSGGNVYFYVFYLTSLTGQAPNGTFALWQPQAGGLSAATNSSLAGVDMVDARVIWDATGQGAVVCLTSQNVMEWHSGGGTSSPDTFDPTGINQVEDVSALLWTGWVNYRDPDYPGNTFGYAYQMQSGDIMFSWPGVAIGDRDLGTFTSQVGQDKVAVWQDGTGLFGFAFLVGGTVEVISEYGNPGDVPPLLTQPIPLQPDVTAVFSQPADATEGTLFLVLADATLNVLARDPVAGWSLVPVKQGTASAQELDAWRVQLSVTDANGVPAAGVELSVSADRPAGAWQPAGNTLLTPGSTATFTADALGRVTFATPAVELDAPQLTVTAAAVGLGATAPVQVSPDAEVQAFLAGTAPLNDLGSLTPEAMLAAVNADGTKLFPVLASAPAGQQSQAASGVAQAISHCIHAGQGLTPGPDDVKSWTLDFQSGVPVYTSSTQSGAAQAPALTGVESLSGWWDSVQNDVESFFHGLRHDAIQIVTCTANWIKDETGEGWHWVVNLAVTIADNVSAEASYLITDIESAFHAVTGFFNKLGADIADAISWLRQNIIDLLKEASANAAVVEHWLTQAPGIVNGCLEHYKELADGFFTSLQNRIDQAIDDLMPELAKVTFGNPVPARVSGPAAGGPPAAVSAPAAFDLQDFVNGARANWLQDKILSYFSGDTAVAPIQQLQDAMDELAVAVQDALAFAEDMGKVLWDGLQAMSGSRGSYNQATFAQFFQALKSAVADLLGFADAVVKALLDLVEAVMDQLGALLTHQFNEIPMVGGLLSRLGVDDTMSVAHLVSMVLMYPATLADRIKNGSGSSLFPATATENLAAAELDWALGLQMSAAVGQGIWGILDMIGDAAAAAQQSAPPLVGWTDIVAPCILNILQWPGALNADGTTAPPFANAIDGAVYDGDLIEPTWLVGWIPPAVGLCGKAADYKPAADPSAPPSPEPDPAFPEIGMYFTALSAVAGTITGSIYNFQTGQSQGTHAAGILSNVSNVVAPFLTS